MGDRSKNCATTKRRRRRELLASTAVPDEGPRERRARQQAEREAEERRQRELRERESDDRNARERSEQRELRPPPSMADDVLWGHAAIAEFVGLPVRRLRYMIQLGRVPVRRHSHRIVSASKRAISRALLGA